MAIASTQQRPNASARSPICGGWTGSTWPPSGGSSAPRTGTPLLPARTRQASWDSACGAADRAALVAHGGRGKVRGLSVSFLSARREANQASRSPACSASPTRMAQPSLGSARTTNPITAVCCTPASAALRGGAGAGRDRRPHRSSGRPRGPADRDPTRRRQRRGYAHPGEEFVYVLAGQLTFRIDESEHYELHAGRLPLLSQHASSPLVE